MTSRIARRTAAAAASVTVAAAALLAVGGTASATELPGSEQSAPSRVADSLSGDHLRTGNERLHDHVGDHHAHHRGHGDDAGRPHGFYDSHHARHWVDIDDARRMWVVDQIQWIHDRGLSH
ncbi:hypothetical protein GCM10010377_70610 [Streptomyces viridiviolaceus]|uniref:Secreted protein n=1 Tax=Streptomyces viridiviolaceus TaxID=68282 RepID=A0ABW2EB37_9ACTN|nr:hypothetical protein [Streptomyces viridiviolaceus]GHB69767.1 hypothetical protein GCM10010377_70610 [Streptomyces viridiviolaceus]